MNDSKINLLNRLVDYVIVCGLSEDAVPEIMFIEEGKPVYKPQLIDRYPNVDYEDIPFPPGVEIFCIPAGVKPISSIKLPKFHHFAATLGNGDRLHGTCLRFFEPVPDSLVAKISQDIKDAKKSTLPEEPTSPESKPCVESHEFSGFKKSDANDRRNEVKQKNFKAKSQQNSSTAELAGRQIVQPVSLADIAVIADLPPPEKKSGRMASITSSQGSETARDSTEIQTNVPLTPASPPPASPPLANKSMDNLGSLTPRKGGRADNLTFNSAPVPTPAAPASTPVKEIRKDTRSSGRSPKRAGNIYAEKCVCVVSHYGFFSQYLDFLRELYRISLSPSKIPMERYIVNLARETPLPPQGCLIIEYKIGQKAIRFSRPPPNRPTDFPPFPFVDLFRILKPETAVSALTALLLEYRVVLVSTPSTNLTLVSELLLQLMYPFKYEHVYIPLLPKTLIEFLAAPMPFLIGIPRDFLDDVDDLRDIIMDRQEMVVVDLDTSEIYASENVIPLPPSERKKLHKRLRPLSKVYRDRSKMNDVERKAWDGRDSAFAFIPSPDELESLQESVPNIDDGEVKSVQAAFLRVFVSMFKDYRKYLIFPKIKSTPPETHASPLPSPRDNDPGHGDSSFMVESFQDPVFRTDDFVRKQGRDSRPFLKKFCATQAFARFAESRALHSLVPGEMENYDIKFFDESITAKNNRSRFRFSKPTPFLNSKEYEVKNSLPAPDPDVSDLPPGRIYQHKYFPRLRKDLFQAKLLENRAMSEASKLNKKTKKRTLRSRKKKGIPGKSIPTLFKQMSFSNANSHASRSINPSVATAQCHALTLGTRDSNYSYSSINSMSYSKPDSLARRQKWFSLRTPIATPTDMYRAHRPATVKIPKPLAEHRGSLDPTKPMDPPLNPPNRFLLDLAPDVTHTGTASTKVKRVRGSRTHSNVSRRHRRANSMTGGSELHLAKAADKSLGRSAGVNIIVRELMEEKNDDIKSSRAAPLRKPPSMPSPPRSRKNTAQ